VELAVTGKKTKIEVSDAVFGRDFSEPLVHQVVTAYLAGARAGTKAQKNRSAVSGGGRKPWKQKGTGRARAGTIRSPIWRGGGKTFAAKDAVAFLDKLGVKSGTLVMEEMSPEVLLATRNIPGIYVTDVAGMDPVSLVSSDDVVMTVDALKKVQEWLA